MNVGICSHCHKTVHPGMNCWVASQRNSKDTIKRYDFDNKPHELGDYVEYSDRLAAIRKAKSEVLDEFRAALPWRYVGKEKVVTVPKVDELISEMKTKIEKEGQS